MPQNVLWQLLQLLSILQNCEHFHNHGLAKEGENWNQAGPCGAPGHGSLSNSCSSGKGGDAGTRGQQPRNNSAALGQGPDPTSRDTHHNIFKLFCRTKTHTKWKMFQREGHSLITSKLIRPPPEARLKECRPCTHPDPSATCPWTTVIKLLTITSRVGTQFFRARAHCGPLCLANQ